MNDFIVWLVVIKSNEMVEAPLSYLAMFPSKEQAEKYRTFYLTEAFHFIDVLIVPVWRSSLNLIAKEGNTCQSM